MIYTVAATDDHPLYVCQALAHLTRISMYYVYEQRPVVLDLTPTKETVTKSNNGLNLALVSLKAFRDKLHVAPWGSLQLLQACPSQMSQNLQGPVCQVV